MSRNSFSFDQREEHAEERARQRNPRRARFDGAPREAETAAIDLGWLQTLDRANAIERKEEASDSLRAHYFSDRTYFVRDSELRTMADIGTFRSIAAADFSRFGYGGDGGRMEREIRRLRQQSLLSERVLPISKYTTIRLFALTRRGARLVRDSGRIPCSQLIYYGFSRLREAKHDADLYRVYHVQAEAILRSGARPTRVVLDYELQRELNRDLAMIRQDQHKEEARAEVAKRHALSVVDGKIQVPDLRVEYDTAEMEHKHLDLELATRNYRGAALALKAKAGFSLFANREDASSLRRTLNGLGIKAEILSL